MRTKSTIVRPTIANRSTVRVHRTETHIGTKEKGNVCEKEILRALLILSKDTITCRSRLRTAPAGIPALAAGTHSLPPTPVTAIRYKRRIT